MDLQFSPEEEAFRAEVRAFLHDKLPKQLAAKVKAGQRLTKADQENWHAILNDKGWLAYHWPKEHGGTGWSAIQKFIFDDECAMAGGPRLVPFGLSMLGPVLMKYGSAEQQARFLLQHWIFLTEGKECAGEKTAQQIDRPGCPRKQAARLHQPNAGAVAQACSNCAA